MTRFVRRKILAVGVQLLTAISLLKSSRGGASPAAAPAPRWLAFYGLTADEAALASYDFVILDPMFEGSLQTIASAGTRVFGYLSLGEVRLADPMYQGVDPAVLLEENQAWPGTFRIDVRHPSWKELVIGRIIPEITAKGFTGLMLDTLDTPPYLELVDPVKGRGMKQAAVELVRAIHAAFPNMPLIINRGYAILADVMADLDGVIAESLLTTPDEGEPGGFKWKEQPEVDVELALLSVTRRPPRSLPLFTLDYWNLKDVQGIAEIYQRQRELGHYPYVASPRLDQIVADPTN